MSANSKYPNIFFIFYQDDPFFTNRAKFKDLKIYRFAQCRKCNFPTSQHSASFTEFIAMQKSNKASPYKNHHLRFHFPYAHLASTFGDDWFALKAESFARFFGTPVFLFTQTVIVVLWIVLNEIGILNFDIYPFILLNLAFSLQAAYAAPLILLAQTRQAERDKAHADADAQHREDLALASEQRDAYANKQTEQLEILLRQNTELTELTKSLSLRIEALTVEVHKKVLAPL